MAGIQFRRFEEADETRAFERGSLALVTLGGVTVGRASYEPGRVLFSIGRSRFMGGG
jgi:hypothetical protein